MIIYTKENCNPCKSLKERLSIIGISYDEILVDDSNKDKIMDKGIQMVPTLEIDDNLFQGREEIYEYLGLSPDNP